MAWNDDDKKNPWGDGQQGPPDLDEALRKARNRLRSLFGGSTGGRGPGAGGGGGSGVNGVLYIAVLLLGAWLLYDSVSAIDQGEVGVVLRFGEFQRTLQPGLNVHFPRPVEKVTKVDVSQVRQASHQAQMLTSDENLVRVDMSVQYRVKDPKDFLFNVRQPEETLHEAAESSLREVVGSHEMDFLLGSGRAQVADETKELLQKILDRYGAGLQVNLVNLADVRPPQEVKDAFDDAIKAREDRERFVNEAQAYANSVIPEARGQAARNLEEAKAYRESTIARAQGDAKRFSLMLSEYEKAPQITRRRMYLETMEQVLSQVSKVIVDVKSGNNMFYLPLDQLIRGHGNVQVPYRLDSDSGSGKTTVVTPPDSYQPRQPDRNRGGGRG